MKKLLIFNTLTIVVTLFFTACQKEENAIPFDWADGTVTGTIDVSPQPSLTLKAPNLTHRGLSRAIVPELISIQNFSESQMIGFLKGVPSFEGKDDSFIKKSIADGNVGIYLSYGMLPGLYVYKTIYLKPDFSNLKELNITLSDISQQSSFESTVRPVKNSPKSFFVKSLVAQSVVLTAFDKTFGGATTQPSIIISDKSGFGDWKKE